MRRIVVVFTTSVLWSNLNLLFLLFSSISILPRCTHGLELKIEGLKHHEHELKLPRPTSDLTSTLTVALTDEGDVTVGIYLLGGCTAPYILKDNQYICESTSSQNIVFHPKLNSIFERQAMPRPRYRHTSVAINGYIWVMGGRDVHDNLIPQVDVYSTLTDSWITLDNGLEIIPDYGGGVSDHAAFAFGEYLYLAGGYTQNYHTLGHTVVIHTTLSMERKRVVYMIKSALNVPRGDVSALTYGNTAILVGGFTYEDGFCQASDIVESYDFKLDQWTVLNQKMMQGRADTNLLYYNYKFYAIGGEQRGSYDSSTGHCSMDTPSTLDLNDNQNLPRRNTDPVSQQFEALHVLESDPHDDKVPWVTVKGKLPQRNLMRVQATPWPDLDAIYIFGGIYDSSSSKNENVNNLLLSDKILVYNEVQEHNPQIFILISGILGLIIAVALAIYYKYKRFYQDENMHRLIQLELKDLSLDYDDENDDNNIPLSEIN